MQFCSNFQNTQKWLTEQKKLFKQTDEVDYDVEGIVFIEYCGNLSQTLVNISDAF